VLEALLERHDPFPALIVDDAWTLVHTNQAALRFFAWLKRGALPAGDNVLRWCFEDDALKHNIVDWPVAARHMYWRLQREVLADPDNPRLAALLADLQPLLPVDSLNDVLDALRAAPPMMTITFRRSPAASGTAEDDAPDTLRFFTLLATIGTAQDITLSRLHLETFVPADEDTRALLASLANDAR
jgi:hypothetical protein